MNIYRFPTASTDLVSGGVPATDDLSSSLSSGLFRGLPSNEPVHVLVRIYVVKVRILFVPASVLQTNFIAPYQSSCQVGYLVVARSVLFFDGFVLAWVNGEDLAWLPE